MGAVSPLVAGKSQLLAEPNLPKRVQEEEEENKEGENSAQINKPCFSK